MRSRARSLCRYAALGQSGRKSGFWAFKFAWMGGENAARQAASLRVQNCRRNAEMHEGVDGESTEQTTALNGMRKDCPMNRQQESRLFALPPELRELIYRFILTKDAPISPQRPSHRLEERQILPIFQTCQRIHQEATEIYFKSNTFRFFDDGELDEIELPLFFRSLSPSRLRLCASISLEASIGPQHYRHDGHPSRCFREYCVGSVEIDTRSISATTRGRTNCCDRVAEGLVSAREKVQAILRQSGGLDGMGADGRARLGSEVGIEFCATFAHLHPDYGQ